MVLGILAMLCVAANGVDDVRVEDWVRALFEYIDEDWVCRRVWKLDADKCRRRRISGVWSFLFLCGAGVLGGFERGT